jgi:hypothetical protein
MQLPNPPWYRRWKVILAGVIGLAAITAVLGLRGLQRLASPDPTAAGGPPPTVVTTTTAVPPTSLTGGRTTTSTRPGVLWHEKGHDIETSPGIRADGAWRIEWSFDCSNFRKYGVGNFKITGDGAFERVEIQKDALVARGRQTFSRGGFGHLTVSSVCDRWTVTVLDA